MFERYTEKARRVVFLARYEASHFGSPYIETEHFLLGILREDKELSMRAIPNLDAESIQQQIEKATLNRKPVPTSVDLPLSNECKRVLAYAAEEANRLNHNHIGSEHVLLGLLREERSLGARLLKERGVTLETVRAIVGNIAEGAPDTDGGTTDRNHLYAEARVVMRRSIVFQNETDGTNCGETFSIDVPRVGDEVSTPQIRGRVTKVVYGYEQADYEIGGQKANLKPEKIVVYVQPLEEKTQ
jgi:ATP-dependent Clp protease ATP-binding subunit ClpA